MAGIDAELPFTPVRIAVLTMSDTRSVAEDKSGNLLEALISRGGACARGSQARPG